VTAPDQLGSKLCRFWILKARSPVQAETSTSSSARGLAAHAPDYRPGNDLPALL
jgi:hypothetical protein